jgi:hypothetical protein
VAKQCIGPLKTIWPELDQFLATSKKHGGLFAQAMVARALNTSRQRVNQLINEGHLEAVIDTQDRCCVTHDGKNVFKPAEISRRYVTGDSLRRFLKTIGTQPQLMSGLPLRQKSK